MLTLTENLDRVGTDTSEGDARGQKVSARKEWEHSSHHHGPRSQGVPAPNSRHARPSLLWAKEATLHKFKSQQHSMCGTSVSTFVSCTWSIMKTRTNSQTPDSSPPFAPIAVTRPVTLGRNEGRRHKCCDSIVNFLIPFFDVWHYRPMEVRAR